MNHLIPILNEIHTGDLPDSDSFISLKDDNLVLTTVKKAEDSDAWIYQWYDSKGSETEAVLTLPKVPKKVVESNFLEVDGKPVSFDGKVVKIKTNKNSVKTIKVYY